MFDTSLMLQRVGFSYYFTAISFIYIIAAYFLFTLISDFRQRYYFHFSPRPWHFHVAIHVRFQSSQFLASMFRL